MIAKEGAITGRSDSSGPLNLSSNIFHNAITTGKEVLTLFFIGNSGEEHIFRKVSSL